MPNNTISPLGPISTPIQALRDAIAASATFGTWIGDTGGAPEDHIHLVSPLPYKSTGAAYTVDDLEGIRPCAIINISHSPGFFFTKNAEFNHIDHGSLLLQFQQDVVLPDGASFDDLVRDFTNNVGLTINEMVNATAEGGLEISEVRNISVISRSDPKLRDSEGDFLFVNLTVKFGLSG